MSRIKTMYCPKCRATKGFETIEGSFCNQCGAELLEAITKCPRCKEDIHIADTFCAFCQLDLAKKDEVIDAEIEQTRLEELDDKYANLDSQDDIFEQKEEN